MELKLFITFIILVLLTITFVNFFANLGVRSNQTIISTDMYDAQQKAFNTNITPNIIFDGTEQRYKIMVAKFSIAESGTYYFALALSDGTNKVPPMDASIIKSLTIDGIDHVMDKTVNDDVIYFTPYQSYENESNSTEDHIIEITFDAISSTVYYGAYLIAGNSFCQLINNIPVVWLAGNDTCNKICSAKDINYTCNENLLQNFTRSAANINCIIDNIYNYNPDANTNSDPMERVYATLGSETSLSSVPYIDGVNGENKIIVKYSQDSISGPRCDNFSPGNIIRLCPCN